jgi:hypothetical protein
MTTRHIQHSFAGGEITPKLTGRLDVSRYQASLAACENWQTLPQGGCATRAPLEFIAAAKYANRACRLERFEFSIEQAYLLEIGHEYIRFFKDGGRLESGGVPVEVETPYQEAELFDIQVAQSADVLYLVHPNHAPRQLNRLSDTSWELKELHFAPPPAVEEEASFDASLTPGALSGTAVTFTSSVALFVDADVDRQIVSGDGRAIITALGAASPSATVEVTILKPFSSTAAIPEHEWFLLGSPVAGCTPDKTGPVGAEVTLSFEKVQTDEPELVSNRKFNSGLTGWDNRSGPLITSGTATSGAADELVDTTKNFTALGVEVGHRGVNLGTGQEGRVDSISTTTNPNDTITFNPAPPLGFATSDNYEIRQSGTVAALGGECQISGGDNGLGWVEQDIATQVGKRYRLLFDVQDAALSVQVGSTSLASDVLAEETHPIGNEVDVRFSATSSTTYLQWRNNQNTTAVLDNVSCKSLSAHALRFTTDLGKFVQLHGGTVEITEIPDRASAKGVIWWPLVNVPEEEQDEPPTAGPGTWVLGVAAWSGSRGYPRTLSFHSNRLYFAGTQAQPLTLWGSVPGKYETFALGPNDNHAVEFDISANQMNTCEWLEPLRDLIVGTRGGEHQLTGGTSPIAPGNIGQIPLSSKGSPPLRPLRVDNVLLHLQRGRRRVREMSIDVDSAQTQTRDVTLLAEHITTSGIRQWAYQAQPLQTVWAVREDGVLVGLTYELLEDIRGWHRHLTGLGDLFESVAVVPVDEPAEGSDVTEEVWVSVKRTCASGTLRTIERFLPSCPYLLDAHLSYSGQPATVFSGLDHLAGCQVVAVADGAVAGTHTVVGGAITLESAASEVTVGLQYVPTLTTLAPELSLSNGSMQGRRQRWVKCFARVLATVGLTINGKQIPFRTPEDAMDTSLSPRDADVSTLVQGWSRAATLTVTQALPFAAHVVCLYGDLEIEELK